MFLPSTFAGCGDGEPQWYDLFSRGARDWLRHNEKVREAVRAKLPEVIADGDLLGSRDRVVRVPVRFLEHFRFRLNDTGARTGIGQGDAKPGDQLVPPGRPDGSGKGEGGDQDGGYQFVLELRVDDIVDWLWEELELPNLKQKSGAAREEDYLREGWNRRGARSRLDRRRSMREALKRRHIEPDGPPFRDMDLRFRQLVRRRRPATQAVVFFAMDVSSSMREQDRQLAKTFFFWVVQGLRRQYARLDTVFVAHTIKAWEFNESEFFQVSGSGGTVASTAFRLVGEIVDERYDPGQFNVYLFYASDGENFRDDREEAERQLKSVADVASFCGYVETPATADRALHTETASIFAALEAAGSPSASFALTGNESVWDGIRAFFSQRAREEAG